MFTMPISFSLVSLPYLIIGYFLEALVLWLFTKNKGLNILKILLATLIANALTAFIGLFVMLGTSLVSNVLWYFGVFVINIVIESSFYIAFFANSEVSKMRFIWSTVIGNFLTFIIVGYGIFLDPNLTTKYLNLIGVPIL